MKGTRIVLLLSPLLLFCPPLLPLDRSLGWTMLGVFYGGLLARFPWNILMAALCYYYAQQLGREAFLWAGGSFLVPFLTPLILAFMSARPGSVQAQRQVWAQR